ncbi:hypothetical protein HK405_011576, partial [Cladochytrium tenue]
MASSPPPTPLNALPPPPPPPTTPPPLPVEILALVVLFACPDLRALSRLSALTRQLRIIAWHSPRFKARVLRRQLALAASAGTSATAAAAAGSAATADVNGEGSLAADQPPSGALLPFLRFFRLPDAAAVLAQL